MTLNRLIEQYMDQEGLNSIEGERGVRNLAKLANALGYQDFNRYGQMPGGACMGDIFAMLEDCPGAIEAIIDWAKSRNVPEWKESLKQRLVVADGADPESELVANHYPACPDCGSEIPDDMVRGEECENCGHVFNWGPSDDHEWDEMEPLFPNGIPAGPGHL